MFTILLIVCAVACFLFFLGNSKIKGGFGKKFVYTLIATPLLMLAIFAAWYLVGVLFGTVVLILKIIIAAIVIVGVVLLVQHISKN
ncbi:MAG: hypothetical protein WC654_04050 [Patescibacteria group bacterium]